MNQVWRIQKQWFILRTAALDVSKVFSYQIDGKSGTALVGS